MIPGLARRRIRATPPVFVTVAVANPLLSVQAGGSVSSTITIVRTNVDATLTLAAVGLPTGITAEFVPPTLSGATLTSQMTLTAAEDAPEVVAPDGYTVTASGTSGTWAFVGATVTVGLPPDVERYSLGGTSQVNLPQDSSQVAVVTIARAPGFLGDVTLSVLETLPTGVTRTGTLLFSGETTSLNWTFAATADAVTAVVPLTIRATTPGEPNVERMLNVNVGGWGFPNAGNGILGPGANAAAWGNKTVYPEATFSATPDGSSFTTFGSFTDPSKFRTLRIEYPTLQTPIGIKRVLQVNYPGQPAVNITTSGQTTTPWEYSDAEYSNVSVSARGTWVGTLHFETSSDAGVTWEPIALTRDIWPNGFETVSSITGPQTSSSRGWSSPARGFNDRFWPVHRLFRVRSSDWVSGTAIVIVGVQGGQSPARGQICTMSTRPTRVYTRILFFAPDDWTDNGSAGTKGFFYSQDKNGGPVTNNHNVAMLEYGGPSPKRYRPWLNLQQQGATGRQGSLLLPDAVAGNWVDFEWIFIANTDGLANGITQCFINGVQCLNETTLAHFHPAATPGFRELWFDPTYGGGNVPMANVFLRYGAWYTESAP